MLVFLCTRYLILILLEVISPLAIACLYNSDTRSSFYTWVRQMVGCYMLYPGFIIASVFSDLIVVNYVQQRPLVGNAHGDIFLPAETGDARHSESNG